MASERDNTIDRQTFEAALGVMQSSQSGPVAVPGPIMMHPPICPSAGCVADAANVVYLLYVVRPNERGDVLLACLNCGYEAVYRISTNKFEARPGRTDAWQPPYRAQRDVIQRMSQGEPAKFSVPKAVKVDSKSPAKSTAVEKPARTRKIKVQAAPAVETPVPVTVQAPETGRLKQGPVKAAVDEIKALSVKEASEIAGVHPNKINFAIRRGELKAQDIAGIKIVLSHDLETWMGVKRG